MKLITRVSHDAKELTGAIFGWDYYWCRDYADLDRHTGEIASGKKSYGDIDRVYGYTIIFALNLGVVRFLKRLFIKVNY